MKLSIVIPVHNESRTILTLLDKVEKLHLPNDISKEVIIVNDFSTDNSAELIKKYIDDKQGYIFLENEVNLGKSRTVRKGLGFASGDFVIVQDADLEYEPAEISLLLEKMLKEELDVVYGNRFGKSNKVVYIQFYLGNRFLSLVSNIFTWPRIRVWIPDLEVCYKLIRKDVASYLAENLVSKSSFGLEPEITARLARYKKEGKRLKFGVVPISYNPRSIAEGKHMHAIKDGFKALKEIIVFNLF